MGNKKQLFKKSDIFPRRGTSSLCIKLNLRRVKNKLKKRKPEQFLGWLYTLPHPLSVYAYSYILDQNPSHLGSWTNSLVEDNSTEKIEKEVIRKMINIYHTHPKILEGYVTSGGTESNLFSAWVGRTYLEKFIDKGKVCLLRTELSHYSVNKAARVVGVKDFTVPLDKNSWGMSPEGFEIVIRKLVEEGYRKFLVPITLGYTLTGSSDDLFLINKSIFRLKKVYKNIHFFVWIDAALNGLTMPFLLTNFSPFSMVNVQTFCVDFHKLGLTPYPTGIILYRKNLKKLIERDINYLPQKDVTISGSRPGSSAVAIWSMIHYLGFDGYKKNIVNCMKVKKHFIERLKIIDPSVTIISDEMSVHLGVIFNIPIEKFDNLQNRFGMFASKIVLNFYPKTRKKYTIYKFYFLPGITKNLATQFLDLLEINLSKNERYI